MPTPGLIFCFSFPKESVSASFFCDTPFFCQTCLTQSCYVNVVMLWFSFNEGCSSHRPLRFSMIHKSADISCSKNEFLCLSLFTAGLCKFGMLVDDKHKTCAWKLYSGKVFAQGQSHSLGRKSRFPVAQELVRLETSLAAVDGCVFFGVLTCPSHSMLCCCFAFSAIESWGFPLPGPPKQSSHARMSRSLIHRGFKIRRLPSSGLAGLSKPLPGVWPLCVLQLLGATGESWAPDEDQSGQTTLRSMTCSPVRDATSPRHSIHPTWLVVINILQFMTGQKGLMII